MTIKIETDVLIVGGGGAGSRAAIEADRHGAKVVMAVKGKLGINAMRGAGATGSGGVNMFRYFPSDPRRVSKDLVYKGVDDLNLMIDRSINTGLGVADPKLIEILVNNAFDARRDLDEWGVTIEPFFDESEIARWIVPLPGLTNIIRGNSNIRLQERMMVADLIIQNGNCVGAVGVNEESGEEYIIAAKSTILATGGKAQLFTNNIHPSCVTGDAYVMGYEAGAELMNIEFDQIFPMTVYPTKNIIPPDVWKLKPRIFNNKNDEFLEKYLPEDVSIDEVMQAKARHNPYSTRDSSKYLEIALSKEEREGGANDHNGFYMEVPEEMRLRSDLSAPKLSLYNLSIYDRDWYEYRGIDWSTRYVEIGVVHQCSNGGLRINEVGQTTIPGLYAIGEASAGPYGADRLGGAMQASCQVFGMITGKHAASNKKKKQPVLDGSAIDKLTNDIFRLRECRGDKKAWVVKNDLKKLASQHLLAVRSKKGISKVLKEIKFLRNNLSYRISVESPPELIEALELNNLLTVGEIVARTALMREESRGGHYREDFPEQDKNWEKAIVVKKIEGEIKLNTLKVDNERKSGIANLEKDWKDLHWG